MMKRQTTKRSRTLEEKASYIKPDNPVERTVYEELVKMGFKESCMGTIYLKDVVSSLTVLMFKYEIKQDKYLSVINAVADKYGVDSAYMKVNMRHSIENALTIGDFDYIVSVLGNLNEYGANGVRLQTFVLRLARKISYDMDKSEDGESIEVFRNIVKESIDTVNLLTLQTIYGIIKYYGLSRECEVSA